ncbi:MAG: CvpA family protein [Muribaculaceae bacterium]|nr:CvpA family protein [Muribaculaceae bacterium]
MDTLNLFYLGIVLLVALVSLAIGFRRGITMQLSSVLGMAFGSVAARVLSPGMNGYFLWVEQFTPEPEFNEFAVNLVCSVVIYAIVFWVFALFSRILQGALSIFEVGMFNRLLGAFFSLLKNLLWLSCFLNILICFKSESGLLRYERANDGNLVASVMALTPAILGCYGGEDFAHFHQLKEAKTISYNRNPGLSGCPTTLIKPEAL